VNFCDVKWLLFGESAKTLSKIISVDHSRGTVHFTINVQLKKKVNLEVCRFSGFSLPTGNRTPDRLE
jgi:hypothetical protein